MEGNSSVVGQNPATASEARAINALATGFDIDNPHYFLPGCSQPTR